MFNGLFSGLNKSKEFQELLEAAEKNETVALYQTSEGITPFLAAALHEKTKRPVMAIVTTELRANHLAEDVGQFLPGQTWALPAREVEFTRASSSNDANWLRLNALYRLSQGQAGFVSLTYEAAMDQYISPSLFRARMITLSEGQVIDPAELIDALLRAGYERVEMVEGKGQCARRGDIIDIYPPQEISAVRIEFFDDEIDTIRMFDVQSQRSTGRQKNITVPPANEFLLKEEEYEAASERMQAILRSAPMPKRALQTIHTLDTTKAPAGDDGAEITYERARWLADAESLAAGIPLRRGNAWLHVLCRNLVTVFDWADNPILLLEQPNGFREKCMNRILAQAEEFTMSVERGEAVREQENLYFQPDTLLEHMRRHCVVTLSEFLTGQAGLSPDRAIDLDTKGTATYQSQAKQLAADVKRWRDAGCCSVICTGGVTRGKHLSDTLTTLDVPNVFFESLDGNLIAGETILLPISLHKGFVWPAVGMVLVADTDLYGSGYRKAKSRKTAGEKISAFTDLKPGDYVVHEAYGIGRFEGLVQKQADGAIREYLAVSYQGTDKLYLPAEQLDRIQRYIGSEGDAPKLNSLGGQEWQRAKAKARGSIKAMAFDLLKLYAKRKATKGHAFGPDTPWQRDFEDNFPYELTPDQAQSVKDIFRDMESDINMDRLLCGDVGYGKTEVAFRAAFKAIMDGKQVAILAPTTILAQQHYVNCRKRFGGFPVNIDVISRFRTPAEQKKIIQDLAEGKIDLIIGTHRLLGKEIVYHDLGLLIVDEEQRFGVAHKEKIKNMKTCVDVLTMSATPIPRTLHMSMVGIRDLSLLETPPEERFPVKTFVMEYQEGIIRDAILREMNRGGQIYVLYNQVQSIDSFYAHLKALVPEARIGIGHGQMSERTLEDTMMDFYNGAYDVLLSTTIIENGLDVPTANTLIVYDSDRLGLSQLYQLRGRVGRSNRQAYAYFTVRPGHMLNETAQKRLSAIREFTEFGAGFNIAMRDLEIRGAGNILGAEQHGHLAAIGYDMYCRMIEQCLREVQGLPAVPDDLETKIELKVNAYLPQLYIADERQRMDLYRRISLIDSESALSEMQDELIDRFGEMPPAVDTLLEVAYLRGLCKKLGIAMVTEKEHMFRFRFDDRYAPDPQKLINAIGQMQQEVVLSNTRPISLLMRMNTNDTEAFLPTAIRRMEKLTDMITAE